MTAGHELLSELLRPQRLGDLTLPQQDIDRLQLMVSAGQIMNMIFCGEPGLGKTSAAKVLINDLGADALVLNGSSATGISHMRECVAEFAHTMSLMDGPKICFIDEADYLSKNAQASLRQLIEDTSDHCRYLFTVNEIKKIDPAIRSRMLELWFDILPSERPDVLRRMQERYVTKLDALGVQYDRQRLAEIIGIYFPDFRQIANRIEYEFPTGH